MSQFNQYADCNFYQSHSASDGRTDGNGYHDHKTLDRDEIADKLLEGHPNEDEILSIMNAPYRSEDLPSNGTTEGYVGDNGKISHCPDTRDLAEQASSPTNYWSNMMLAYQSNIRKLARWVGGYHAVTKDSLRFDKKLSSTKARMKREPVYAAKLAKRWGLLKMCNKSLC